MYQMQFPTDWPENCPPQDAEDAHGNVYRVVKLDPVGADDFRTQHETGRMPNAPACLRCGLSVFQDLESAQHQHDLFPKLGGFIAKGRLESKHGKIKRTPTSRAPRHTTWWCCIDVRRHALFSVVWVAGAR